MKLDVRIKKFLRDFVLDVEFSVRDEVFTLLGASGAGKSMTLKIIAGIEHADEGRIVLNGRTLFDSTKKINLPPQARKVGYLFQNCALFPNMTVAENILFAASGNTSEKIFKLQENLSRFKIKGLENSYPHELSGGQAQRVALARVLASHAELLLLDEPFSALDSHLKWQLELELAEVLKIYGAAILVSHDRDEVFRLTDKVAVINAGKLEAIGSKHEIFLQPPTVAAALLTGCQNISAAKKITDDKIFAEDWRLTLTAKKIPDDLKFIGIHARDLAQASEMGENIFSFEVVNIIEEPQSFIVTVQSADAEPLRWQVVKNFWRGAIGDKVSVCLPADKILLLRG
ncbi:MAG: ATP-binding cassette domain-containing protein [Selenomonadaceae bacterium]|nr:ATP-binding cassette domain-containing protein [Selenomonadaceae bacterium]